MNIIIPAQVAGATADFTVDGSHSIPPVSVISNNLAGVETVAVHVSDDNGVTFTPLFDYGTGTAVVLDATHNAVGIANPGRYRVVKSATVAAVGVAVSTSQWA